MTCVATNMPHLPAPQARLLAWWSFGIAHTRSLGGRYCRHDAHWGAEWVMITDFGHTHTVSR